MEKMIVTLEIDVEYAERLAQIFEEAADGIAKRIDHKNKIFEVMKEDLKNMPPDIANDFFGQMLIDLGKKTMDQHPKLIQQMQHERSQALDIVASIKSQLLRREIKL